MKCACLKEFCISCIYERTLTNPTDVSLLKKGVFKLLNTWNSLMKYHTIFSRLSHSEITRLAMYLLSLRKEGHHMKDITLIIIKNRKCDLTFHKFASLEWLEQQHDWYLEWSARIYMPEEKDLLRQIASHFNQGRHQLLYAQRATLFIMHSFRLLYGRDVAKIIAKLVYDTRRDPSWFISDSSLVATV